MISEFLSLLLVLQRGILNYLLCFNECSQFTLEVGNRLYNLWFALFTVELKILLHISRRLWPRADIFLSVSKHRHKICLSPL